MGKFNIQRGYVNYDALDDTILKDGDKLLIRFPNGKKEKYTIKVFKYFNPDTDMGQHLEMYEAFITIVYNGIDVNIRLVKESLLEAEFI